jgi:hypothetical protein
VELQELRPFRAPCVRRLLLALVVLASSAALLPATALAWYPPGSTDPITSPPGTPALVASMTTPPSGFHLVGNEVLSLARHNTIVIDNLRGHPTWVPYVYTRDYPVWQVSWFTPPNGKTAQREMIEVYVDDQTAQVTQVWTGYQVAWTMARGYAGAFGRKINRWYLWVALCVAFLLPFIPWRRRPTLWHLDLLMLLGFSISLDAFNKADLGLSVPLVYPFLLYMLVRLVLLAYGRGRPRAPLRLLVQPAWLVIGLVFLIGFRVGLNITDSNVIDVGFAGVIGGSKIIHGEKLYGDFPSSNPAGDTYGPVTYYAYAPAVAIFGWSGSWDSLPAAHAAAIAFDLLTMLCLFLLGRRVRGPTLGIVLAYMWAAYPFTTYTLSSNSNDALVALLTVLALLAVTSAPGRGVMAALAGLTKFAPLALAPLMLRGVGDPPRPRTIAIYLGAFALATFAVMAQVLFSGNFHAFWQDTVVYQVNRPAPFSIWGLWGGAQITPPSSLRPEQRIVEGLTVLFALSMMWFPRGRRDVVQVAALGAAALIAVQCCLAYWFYLYIVWFFALAIFALAAAHPAEEEDVKDRGLWSADLSLTTAPAPA